MQNDLISRQSLMAHFETSQALVNDRDVLYCNGVLDVIAREPSVDAVPVVHARWLPRGSDDNDAGMYYCSACKDERYFGDEVITSEEASKYCPFRPNCGAKMDGVDCVC